MNEFDFPILTLMLGVPMAAAILCLFTEAKLARHIALLATMIDLIHGIVLWTNFQIAADAPQWQFTASAPIFGRFAWEMGLDGNSLMLLLMNVFIMLICIGALWSRSYMRVGDFMGT